MARSLTRLLAIVTLTLVGWLGASSPAMAHGEDETKEGYVLVQQALGHLAHDTSAAGIDLAMEKVEDALSTDDQEGVNLTELKQGMAALQAGNVDQARSLLQDSIKDALDSLPPATGSQTGTTAVTPELPGRSGFSPQDWGFLAGSTVALLLGLWLAIRFRPHDTIRTLRSLLGPSTEPVAAESPHSQEGH
jgi:hypothetical protein